MNGLGFPSRRFRSILLVLCLTLNKVSWLFPCSLGQETLKKPPLLITVAVDFFLQARSHFLISFFLLSIIFLSFIRSSESFILVNSLLDLIVVVVGYALYFVLLW